MTASPVELSPTSATIRWTDGATNGLEITGYRVETMTDRFPVWTLLTTVPAAATQPYYRKRSLTLFNQLQPWNSYRFRISVGNAMGFSPASLPSPSFDVPVAPPTRPPVNVIGGGGRAGVLRVSWSPLMPHEQNAPGLGYKVYYKKFGSTGDFQEKIVDGNRSRLAVSVGEEEVFQPYEVRLRAFNSVGDGPLGDVVTVYSAEQGTSILLCSIPVRMVHRNDIVRLD